VRTDLVVVDPPGFSLGPGVVQVQKPVLCRNSIAFATPRIVPHSGRSAMIEAEEAAQAFPPGDLAVASFDAVGSDQAVRQPLMIPLKVVVLHVLGDRLSKMRLSQRYDPVQTLASDGQDGALMNLAHGIRVPRSGAGSMPCSCKMRLIVFRPISWPRFRKAPLIRV